MSSDAILKIITVTGGERTEFNSRAHFERTETGFKLGYLLDGDEGIFVMDGDSAVLVRRGSFNMNSVLKVGVPSVCEIEEDGLRGSLPAKTFAVRRRSLTGGEYIFLDYSLAEERYRVTLKITFA